MPLGDGGQLTDPDAQCGSEPPDIQQSHVAATALDLVDVGPLQFCALGKGLL